MGISANSKNKELAGKYLMGLYSEEYQSGIVSDGGFVSAVKGINEKAMNDRAMQQYYNLHKENGKLAPDTIVGKAETAAVYAKVKDINPSLGQIMQGVISGGIKDYSEELDLLADKTQTEWELAIHTVSKEGIDASKEDFEF